MTFSGLIQSATPEACGTSATGTMWRRRDYVMLYDNSNAQFPKTVLFSVYGDKIDELNIQLGNEYDVELGFSTRWYKGKTYMSATAWKATPRAEAAQQTAAPQPEQPEQPAQPDEEPFPF